MPMTSSVVKQVVSQLTESPVTPGPMPGIVGALLKEGVMRDYVLLEQVVQDYMLLENNN